MTQPPHATTGAETESVAAGPIPNETLVAGGVRDFGTLRFNNNIVDQHRCESHSIYDLGGSGKTDAQGVMHLKLSRFHCEDPKRFERPLSVVATPRGTEPVYLTVSVKSKDEIDVHSWRTGAVAAPNVSFYWRCSMPMRPGSDPE